MLVYTAGAASKSRLKSIFGRISRAAFAALMIVAAGQTSAQSAEEGPFSHLIGMWSGTGSIALTNGTRERIRCRAEYHLEVDRLTLRLGLRCESDSYKFDLRSQIRYQDGQISGVWSENTRGVAGKITGKLTPTQIQARAEGQTFSAILSMRTRTDRQTVSITSPGSEMSEVSIVLTRRSR
jgi:hypothetical protein